MLLLDDRSFQHFKCLLLSPTHVFPRDLIQNSSSIEGGIPRNNRSKESFGGRSSRTTSFWRFYNTSFDSSLHSLRGDITKSLNVSNRADTVKCKKFLIARGGGEKNTWKFIAPHASFDRPTFFIHTLKLNHTSSRCIRSFFPLSARVCVYVCILDDYVNLATIALDHSSISLYIFRFSLSVNAQSAKTRINIIECLVLFRGNNNIIYEWLRRCFRWITLISYSSLRVKVVIIREIVIENSWIGYDTVTFINRLEIPSYCFLITM